MLDLTMNPMRGVKRETALRADLCPTSRRCGARTRRESPCKAPAMTNGRCRMHGGCSTGPKTPEGLARSRMARWKTGRYSQKARARQRGLAWVGRVTSVLRNYGRLMDLLMRIAKQIDTQDALRIEAMCRTALRLWRQYQKALATEPTQDRSPAPEYRPSLDDEVITLMLEAGAAGEPPNRIRAILRGHVNLSTGANG